MTFGVNIGDLCTNTPWKPRQILNKLNLSKDCQIVKFWHSESSKINPIISAGQFKQVYLHMNNDEMISNMNFESWIQQNVKPIVQRFRQKEFFLVVGNEVLAPWNFDKYAFKILKALRECFTALKTLGLERVKIVTPLDMTCVQTSYPPSAGRFKTELTSVLKDIVRFTINCKSVMCFNIYPFFARQYVSETFALFGNDTGYEDQGRKYTNLFEAQYDSILHAIQRLGIENSEKLELVCTETGWPTGGTCGASVENMKKYLEGIKNVAERGTPLKPGAKDIIYFELYDESLKNGPEFEKCFGIFTESGRDKI